MTDNLTFYRNEFTAGLFLIFYMTSMCCTRKKGSQNYHAHGITSWDLPPFPNWIYTSRKNETSGTKKTPKKQEGKL